MDHGSSAGDDGTGGGDERCATCGGRVDASEWHPIRVRRGGDGPARVDAFCSQHCREAAGGRELGD